MQRAGAGVTRQIVAIGGQGFDPKLVVYILGQARSEAGTARRRVCFIGAASGDDPANIVSFYKAYAAPATEVTHLELFQRTVDDLAGLLALQDVIYVGGGNTVNMLAIWRAHGVDKALRAAHEGGTVLCGSSAGCICWFEAGITDSYGLALSSLRDGLGLLRGSACPHYDSEERRRPVYTAAVRDGFPAGIALEDGVAAHYVDGELREIVSARPEGRAFRVDATGEHALPVRVLA
jgi:peptidase E